MAKPVERYRVDAACLDAIVDAVYNYFARSSGLHCARWCEPLYCYLRPVFEFTSIFKPLQYPWKNNIRKPFSALFFARVSQTFTSEE